MTIGEEWTILLSSLTLVATIVLGAWNLLRQKNLFDEGRRHAKADRDLAELRRLRAFVGKINSTLGSIFNTLVDLALAVEAPVATAPEGGKAVATSLGSLSKLVKEYTSLRHSPEFVSLNGFMNDRLKASIETYANITLDVSDILSKYADTTLTPEAKSAAIVAGAVEISLREKIFAEAFGFLEGELRRE